MLYDDICQVKIQEMNIYIPPLQWGIKQQNPSSFTPPSKVTVVAETCPTAVLTWHRRVQNLLRGLRVHMGRKSNVTENKVCNGYTQKE